MLNMLDKLGVELPLDVVGLAAKFVPSVCSGHWPRQIERNVCNKFGGVFTCLGPTNPNYSQCWDRCCALLTSDPMILGVIEHLGVSKHIKR